MTTTTVLTKFLCIYSEGRPGVFATTIAILPGTHHIRFLVDNNMQTSPDLPTTVDFGNNLVNYIEVSPDDVPDLSQDSTAVPTPQETPSEDKDQGDDEGKPQQQREKQILPPDAFSRIYPQYLLDYDEPEDSPVAQAAAAAIEKLDTPPSLPGFLAKPILNASTLLKDDNSVLNMPNHTTLNHLATSSIKNGTLAVSATTRYRDKVGCPLDHCPQYMRSKILTCSSMSLPSCTSRYRITRESLTAPCIDKSYFFGWSLGVRIICHTAAERAMGLTALIGKGRKSQMVVPSQALFCFSKGGYPGPINGWIY